MRIVVDTNVLLDLWVFDNPQVATLRRRLNESDLEPLWSAACDDELADVLARPQFELCPPRQRELRDEWAARTTWVAQVFPARFACTDPQDQKFVDLAVSGRASLLLSRDRALLRLDRKLRADDLRVVSPGAALDTLLHPPAHLRASRPPAPLQSSF